MNDQTPSPRDQKNKSRQAAPAVPREVTTAISDTKRMVMRVAAAELAELDVHPLADSFPMISTDRLERLAESLEQKQEHPIVVCRGVVIDGRNRIAAGKLKNLKLRVQHRDDLTEEQIRDLIFALNIERRNLPKQQAIAMAIEYYEKYNPDDKSITLDTVAQMFAVGRRSVCRYRDEQKRGPKPKKLRASMDRIPPGLHDVVLALSNIWRLKETKRGRLVIRRLKARLMGATAEIMSQPEMEPAWQQAYPDGTDKD